ncbi:MULTISPECIES: DUF952 domain-containing protein [Paenibacillus]|uniref:DUF952 domain-containing protein n=1 Tax=Paenibacillus TaxID=44249 RepID=UPI000FD7AA1A|nr:MULTISPECIES: DUF952 domain-containing protein [Paenibacillus]MBE7683350.1 DUF952 domain-containing protein [Paenibacillus sp. P13VS]MBY0215774.1 DUF952 domain-containing protein [Paenibacillus illinoisensis]MCM3207328.1 DUF952 domain-containing protein [Paenibacillus illinoisensis]
MIYSIISQSVWEQVSKESVYAPDSLETDGFIHCSTKEQIPWVAAQYYAGRTDLLLLGIDEKTLKPELVYEDLYELNELFPHIYGELNLDAVKKVIPFPPNEEGVLVFPE